MKIDSNRGIWNTDFNGRERHGDGHIEDCIWLQHLDIALQIISITLMLICATPAPGKWYYGWKWIWLCNENMLTSLWHLRWEKKQDTGPYGWDATLALEVSPVKTWILNMRFDYAQYGKSMVMHVSMIWPNKSFQMSFDPIPKFTLYAIEEMTN